MLTSLSILYYMFILYVTKGLAHKKYLTANYVDTHPKLFPELFIIAFAAEDEPDDRKLNPGIEE